MKKVGIGVIGCGRIAERRHVPEYASHRQAELIGYFDFRREKAEELARQYGGRAFGSVEELLADETRLEAFLGLATQDAGTLMGIPKANLLPPEEELGMKLDLLVRQIRFDNKGVE